jgi:hypothetical protein
MAYIVNGYISLEDIKVRLGIDDNNDDQKIIGMVAAMSRFVDTYCRRRFYVSSSDETRYFTPINSTYCRIDDLASITSLAIDSGGNRAFATTWSTTDYDLIRQTTELAGFPYIGIQTTPNSQYTFYPYYYRSVKVVGKFGFEATSAQLDVIREATVLQVARMIKRPDAPYGVAGSGNLGQAVTISDVDPDIRMMLAPPLRKVGAL